MSFSLKKIPPKTILCGGFLSANAPIAKKETFVVGLCLVRGVNGNNVVKMVFITALVKLIALSLQIRMNKS